MRRECEEAERTERELLRFIADKVPMLATTELVILLAEFVDARIELDKAREREAEYERRNY